MGGSTSSLQANKKYDGINASCANNEKVLNNIRRDYHAHASSRLPANLQSSQFMSYQLNLHNLYEAAVLPDTRKWLRARTQSDASGARPLRG